MGEFLRGLGWAWLLVGMLAVGLGVLAQGGHMMPVGPQTPRAMALPWSALIGWTGMPAQSLSAMAIVMAGIVLNAAVLMAIGSMVRR